SVRSSIRCRRSHRNRITTTWVMPDHPNRESSDVDSRIEREEVAMTDVDINLLGPDDYLVVEFPAGESNFTGQMASELLALVDAGTIRVIDVLILTKNADGTVDAMELSDVPNLGELQTVEAELAELLAAE